MNQEIKERLEQAMRKQFTLKASKDKVRRIAYFSGAQTILENPEQWGLFNNDLYNARIKSFAKQVHDLEVELEFYKRRADHDPNSPFNKIADAVDKKLTQLLGEQKKDGKKFISDEQVDQLIDKILREELGNDTGRS